MLLPASVQFRHCQKLRLKIQYNVLSYLGVLLVMSMLTSAVILTINITICKQSNKLAQFRCHDFEYSLKALNNNLTLKIVMSG